MRLRLVGAGAMAIALATFANLLLEAWLVPPLRSAAPLRVQRREPAEPRLDLAVLARTFGTVARPRPGPAPSRPLPLKLLGTLDGHAAALVELASGRCRTLRSGETWDDVEVVGVGHGRITVRRGGALEELGIGAVPAAAPAPGALPISFSATGATLWLPRAELLGRLPAALAGARLLPAFVEGRLAGFKLAMIVPGGIEDQLGLKRGDVLESVNGTPLDSVDAAMGLVAQLETASTITIVLNRGGSRLSYTLRVER